MLTDERPAADRRLEAIVRVLRGDGATDAANADTGRRILAELARVDAESCSLRRHRPL